jgi:hypothetical protein
MATADCLITFASAALRYTAVTELRLSLKNLRHFDRWQISFRFVQFRNCLLRSAAACDVALGTRTTLLFYIAFVFLITAFCIHVYIYTYIYIHIYVPFSVILATSLEGKPKL